MQYWTCELVTDFFIIFETYFLIKKMSNAEEVKLYLETLKKDLPMYKEPMMEVSKEIVAEGFSEYPIFVASQVAIELGELILNREELATSWSIYASTLEEFTEKGIVLENKVSEFKKTWKNPNTYCCIFLITPLGASFLYIPYSKKVNATGFDFNPN